MSKAISSARKKDARPRKIGRGRPRVDAIPVNVRMPPDELKALDAWIAAQDEKITRQQALRKLAEFALTKGGK